MKKVAIVLALLAGAFTGGAQTAQFTMAKISPTTLQVFFRTTAAIGPVTTGISNVTFVLQIPQTFPNPDALWGAASNSTYLGSAAHQTVTSTANGNMWNTEFSYTSNPNISGTTFAANTDYLLATITLPSGVAPTDVLMTDWGNNQINNNTGAPLWATSIAIDGVDRTNNAAVFYQSASSLAPVNSGNVALQSTIAINPAPLGLTLLNFSGTLSNKTVFLKWQSANEKNTSYFDVLRSEDAREWNSVGKVAAAGTKTTTSDYALNDDIRSVISNSIYYRLRMVDLDGSYTYSNTLTFYPGKDNNDFVKVYPTAVSKGEDVTVAFSDSYIAGQVAVFNSVGQLITKSNVDNSGKITIGTTDLAAGMYFVKLMSAQSNTDIARFIIH
ncbi:T9SS type A sorting domain-containing protein [Taibaiella soli]|uniref:Secretion system C-terminal sorting domain-containing protein n=1 Tax=Taibaiella soli TaxID=1649169 RepID=A0A2W2AIM4_9BACT|nr:T9SS type A sorting domain-containing protein [Taibaiella soli]PZF73442.1 hypothetical protein DN068_08615 [Taibaiella soli]